MNNTPPSLFSSNFADVVKNFVANLDEAELDVKNLERFFHHRFHTTNLWPAPICSLRFGAF